MGSRNLFDTEKTAVFYSQNDPLGEGFADHRVWLRRKLREGAFKPAVFILHNPSVAGTTKNDPTATRGINFAIAWGASDLIFVNASTAIATKATDLDPDNLNCPWSDWALEQAAKLAHDHDGYLVAAWGSPKGKAETCRRMTKRFDEIKALLPGRLSALRVSPHGWPEHPLYLPSSLTPEPYA
jgi:hypothetical protein